MAVLYAEFSGKVTVTAEICFDDGAEYGLPGMISTISVLEKDLPLFPYPVGAPYKLPSFNINYEQALSFLGEEPQGGMALCEITLTWFELIYYPACLEPFAEFSDLKLIPPPWESGLQSPGSKPNTP